MYSRQVSYCTKVIRHKGNHFALDISEDLPLDVPRGRAQRRLAARPGELRLGLGVLVRVRVRARFRVRVRFRANPNRNPNLVGRLRGARAARRLRRRLSKRSVW